MSSTANALTPILVSAAPLVLLTAGLIQAYSRSAVRLNAAATWVSFTCALLAALIYPFNGSGSWSFFSVVLPGEIGAFSISTYVNGLTIIMLLLVSFVGVVVSRYARNYLDGEANQSRFHKWLGFTLTAILTLIISGNLLMFSLAWIATSLCLHELLMFYRERPAAVLAAHKKFVASRIGDLSLLTATFLIGSTLHTLEFEEIFQIMAATDGPVPVALQWAAGFIVVSAALKSAQFPFHGWLIQVMEAPTPVSALLHAGIVNAGAFLILRMSPIVSHSTTAMVLLAAIGLITLSLASLVMLTQTSIKVSLAWSTTAQMGFMLLECGLGLYSLAMLHLVAHSLYKAHAFLASGSGVDGFRAPTLAYAPVKLKWWHWLSVMALMTLMTVAIGVAFGVTLEHQPALIAAGSIVAIAMTQILLQAANMFSSGVFLLRALALSAVVCTAYFALHSAFDYALHGSVLPLREVDGVLQTVLTVLVVFVFLGLLVIQQALKDIRSPLRETLYMHLYNGLYIDVFITRVLQRVWPGPIANAKYYGD